MNVPMKSILKKEGFFFCENHISIKLVYVSKISLGIGRGYRRGRDKTRRGRRRRNEIMEPEPEGQLRAPSR